MEFVCTALTALKKAQRHRLSVIQNRYFHYARREDDSICISNDGLRSYCSIISVKQRIPTVENNQQQKASNNNDDIGSFAQQHHETNNDSKTTLNIIIGNKFF